jgi:cell wall-associated NlpC family hydrolase
MEGRILRFRHSVVRKRVAALIACSLIATTVPLSVTAEYGIPAGSGATITAGQPILVRVAPGWDAEVSYEIADGSYVTVWGAEQAAADGTLWYPVDGGFVPAETVTSVAAMEGGVALYQEAAPAEGWVDPATGLWVDAATQEWVDPAAASEGWVDPTPGEWVDPAASKLIAAEGWVDPATGEWVDPNAAAQGWVDPVTGEWVDPNVVSEGYVDPVTGEWVATFAQEAVASDEWVDPNVATEGYVDPSTGEWVDPNAAAGEGWVDPATGEWVEPAGKTEEWLEPAAVESVDVAPEPEWVEPAPVNTGGVESWGDPIGTAYIAGTNGDGAACRTAPERGTEKIAVLYEGEAVEVRGEAVGEWQPVNCAGVGGYVNTSLISWEPAATEEFEQRRRDKNRGVNGNGGANAGNDGTASASGQQIASFAMQYEGYPYVYAGEGPYAFDCSGFTKFVVQNTLGIDITHDMFAQYEMGQQVRRDQLQPGDLVFFQNTFRPGMSHNGIYIGNGQMIHAENESTGVKISDINSDYYSSRWFGAVRIS